ncbi:ComF family protein [Phenylobacterium koreense]|uniref:ComF family protein n=1 Tax=Phenylobacterium koreense TaxID=266125 RepID=A0ABV2EN19_9CAUL
MDYPDGDAAAWWKPGPRTKAAVRTALDLLFPPQSLGDGAASMTSGFNADAWMRIPFIDGPLCDGCGAPFEYDLGRGVRCADCMAKPRAFSRARAACLYDEASRGPILQLKHADRTDLAPMFARWISRSARELLEEADALVPVPLHRSRLLGRRFNQAAEIARPLSRISGVAYLPDSLARVRSTGTQGGKSASGRRRNVAAAFAVPPARRRQVEGRNLLLIDDVMTTGATLEGCARALRTAGAARVDVAVVARVKEAANRAI